MGPDKAEMADQIEELIQQCIDRLAHGASVEELLLAYPEAAPLVEPALRSAHAVLALPRSEPSATARSAAMGRMLNELSFAPAAPPHRIQWFAPFVGRSRAFQAAAVAASVALVGVAGLGAAAATGAGPEPVREFFGLATSSVRVELEGVVVSVEPSDSTLQVSAGGTIRTVIVQPSTELSRGGAAITLGDIATGDLVEVKGELQADDTILAVYVRLEDEADDTTATPEPSPAAPVLPPPTVDDARDPDDDGDDNSGPGDGDDDDDNSGPGTGDDDDDGDNSGPGSGDAGDDNSGPGSGGDDDDDDDPGADSLGDDDDDSGPASGGEVDDDGESGSGGGEDDD